MPGTDSILYITQVYPAPEWSWFYPYIDNAVIVYEGHKEHERFHWHLRKLIHSPLSRTSFTFELLNLPVLKPFLSLTTFMLSLLPS